MAGLRGINPETAGSTVPLNFLAHTHPFVERATKSSHNSTSYLSICAQSKDFSRSDTLLMEVRHSFTDFKPFTQAAYTLLHSYRDDLVLPSLLERLLPDKLVH